MSSSSSLYSTGAPRSRGSVGGAGATASEGHPTDDPSSKGPRRGRRAPFGRLCAVVAALALAASAVVGWWLYPPLLKAWRNVRSPDHPSEASFATGVGKECVGRWRRGAWWCAAVARWCRLVLPRADAARRMPPSRRAPQPFPSINDAPSRFLSVVVPAYNEEKRMRVGLDEMTTFLRDKQAKDACVTGRAWCGGACGVGV